MSGMMAVIASNVRAPVVSVTAGPSLVLDLDAANFVALPSVGGSFNLNGTSQYLSIASSSAFAFGTADYTIEGWFYTTSNSGRLWYFGTNTDNVDLNGNGGIFYWNGSQYQSATNTVINLNTWQHIALVRSSGTITLYVNGVSVMSQSGIGYDSSSNRTLEIGYSSAQGNNYFNGRISNFRIVKGTAVYTANFTPATQPLYPITNTVLLIRPQDSGTLLTDYSAAPLTVTNNGTVTYNAATPFTTITDATGNYPITITNPTPRISWSSDNGGVFRVTTASTNNFMTFGPNYSSGSQAFTVGMAYKWNGTTAGRLLNANSASPDFLMGLWGSGAGVMNIAYGDAFVGSSSTVADTAWHFIWFSNTGSAGATKAKSYVATNTAPSTTFGTGSTNNGFNGLRLFGRFINSTTSTEQVDADVGFVKVWNKELSLAEIQAEHATYKARFGY